MTLKTLEYIQTVDAERFVPSHALVVNDIKNLAQINIRAITAIKEKILNFCSTPVTFEMLLKKIFDAYNMSMSAQQYVLIGSTIRSYLSAMYEEKDDRKPLRLIKPNPNAAAFA